MSECAHRVSNLERYPEKPDGRYFVVRSKLWRCANAALPEETRKRFVQELMAARKAVAFAKRAADQDQEKAAHAASMRPNARSASAAQFGGRMALRISTGGWRRTHLCCMVRDAA